MNQLGTFQCVAAVKNPEWRKPKGARGSRSAEPHTMPGHQAWSKPRWSPKFTQSAVKMTLKVWYVLPSGADPARLKSIKIKERR